MSGLYVPGAFKKKSQEEKLVADGKIPAPQVPQVNTWGGKPSFASMAKIAKEEEKTEKKEMEIVRNISKPDISLDDVRFQRYFRENSMQLEELYQDMLGYDGAFLDKLKKREDGLEIFSRFVWSLI